VPEFRRLDVYHGEAVAFFTLVQIVLENRQDVVRDVFRFCRAVGLPVSLCEIGLHEPPELLLRRGIRAAFVPGGYIYNVPTAVNEGMVLEAMQEADSIGRALFA
jgi:glycerol dehydrogenase